MTAVEVTGDVRPFPYGVQLQPEGGAIFRFHTSAAATSVRLCLFNADGSVEEKQVPMRVAGAYAGGVIWEADVPEATEGTVYGYRVDGPYNPDLAQYFNPNKLLIDDRALEAVGQVEWRDEVYHYHRDSQRGVYQLYTPDARDNAPYVPKARIVNPERLQQPNAVIAQQVPRPLVDDATMEIHVKGFTKQWPGMPEHLRGTYAGLMQPEVIQFLKDSGINNLCLMPISTHVDDERFSTDPRFKGREDLTNYWGYNSLLFMAPHAEYSATGKPAEEFAEMVRVLREHGIEVTLDMVFNHTMEGDPWGATLAWRGRDDSMYHRWHGDRRHYYNATGTGNTTNMEHEAMADLALDTLAFYQSLGVSSVRFDLMASLGREGEYAGYNRHSQFYQRLQYEMYAPDGRLRGMKMTGEPWDVGEYGQQQGNTPFAEWNDYSRHIIHEAALSPTGTDPGKLADALTGSATFGPYREKGLQGMVNAAFTHDGNTLRDLTEYSAKRNWDNGEMNRDGPEEKFRGNHGVEGPTDAPHIVDSRLKAQQFALSLLAIAQGQPLVNASAWIGHTQQGNSNAYLHDNGISWLAWEESLEGWQRQLRNFAKAAFRFRQEHPALRRTEPFTGHVDPATGMKDISWWHPSGREMGSQDWGRGQTFGMVLSGETGRTDQEGRPMMDDALCILVNAGNEPVRYLLPPLPPGHRWLQALNSSMPDGHAPLTRHEGYTEMWVPPRSLIALEGGVRRHLSLVQSATEASTMERAA